jgi:hypothetical protein
MRDDFKVSELLRFVGISRNLSVSNEDGVDTESPVAADDVVDEEEEDDEVEVEVGEEEEEEEEEELESAFAVDSVVAVEDELSVVVTDAL